MPQSKCIRQISDGRFLARYRFGRHERRRLFENREEAVQFIKCENQRIRAFGQTAIELTGSQLGRIVSLVTDLAREANPEKPKLSEGVVLIEQAIQFWQKNKSSRTKHKRSSAVLVDEAVASLIAQWKKENKNPGYISNAGSVLRRFAREHPRRPLADIPPAELKEWVISQAIGSRVSIKARISALYAFGILNEWVDRNPCALFVLQRTTRHAVEVPTAEEISDFLRKTVKPIWEPLVPYFCIRLFAGLRRDEALKLQWKHIDFGRRRVVVPSGIAAKNGPAREVPLADNLADWLREYPRGVLDKIAPPNAAEMEADFRRTNKFIGPKWHNMLRHAFGSYRYPQLGNLETLAAEMGNSKRVLIAHYIGSVSPEDVISFWQIRKSLIENPGS